MATPLRDPLSVAAPIFPENTEGASLFKTYMAAVGKAREARLKGNNKYADYTTKQLNTKIGSDWTAELSEELQPEVDKIQEDYHNYLTQDEAAHGDLTPAHQAEILARWQAVKDKAQGANGDWKILEARNAVVSKGGYDEIKSHARTGALLDPAGFLAEKSNKDIDPEFYNKVQEDYNKMKGESENGKVSPREFAARFHSDTDYDIVKETKPFDLDKFIKPIKIGDIIDGSSIPTGMTINDALQKNYTPEQRTALTAKIMTSVGNAFDSNIDEQAKAQKSYDKLPESERAKYKDADNPTRAWVIATGSQQLLNQKNVSNVDKDYAIASSSVMGQESGKTQLSYRTKPFGYNITKDDGSKTSGSISGYNTISLQGMSPSNYTSTLIYDAKRNTFNKGGVAVKGNLTDITTFYLAGKEVHVAVITDSNGDTHYTLLSDLGADTKTEIKKHKAELPADFFTKYPELGDGSGTTTPNNNAAPRPK